MEAGIAYHCNTPMHLTTNYNRMIKQHLGFVLSVVHISPLSCEHPYSRTTPYYTWALPHKSPIINRYHISKLFKGTRCAIVAGVKLYQLLALTCCGRFRSSSLSHRVLWWGRDRLVGHPASSSSFSLVGKLVISCRRQPYRCVLNHCFLSLIYLSRARSSRACCSQTQCSPRWNYNIVLADVLLASSSSWNSH